MYTLGQYIRDKRKQLGIRSNEFAASIGVSHTYWSDVEHDRRDCQNIFLLQRIAEVLGIDLRILAFYNHRLPYYSEQYDNKVYSDETILAAYDAMLAILNGNSQNR